MSQYFGAGFDEGIMSIEQSIINKYIQLNNGSQGESIALIFFIDLVVRWFLALLIYFFISDQF